MSEKLNKPKNIESIYPLSPMQQGMLFHTLYASNSGVYFKLLSCTLHGDVNVLALKQAWQRVMERHSVLRTFFVEGNRKKPLQVVCKRVNLPWMNYDWRSLTLTEQQDRLETFLQTDRDKGFELKQAPLMRCTIIRLEEDTYQFIWSFHHLLLDGWCMPIIFEEVFSFYRAFIQGKDLYLETPRPYRDYISWLQQQDLSQSEAFWCQDLRGFTAPTPLIADMSVDTQSNQKQIHEVQQLKVSATVTAALQSLAKQKRLTLNTLVQGTWALLLSRYSGESDVVFGFTVSGRPPDLLGMESMVGLFINTLPVRVQVPAEAELLSWLQQLQVQQVERQQYSYSALVEIQGWSEVPRGMPLFESIIVFENYPVDASLWERISSLKISNVRTFDQTNYPLTVVADPGSELSIQISYDTSRFKAATIRRMMGHFQTLLEGIVTNPQQRVSELPLLTAAEQQQILVEWNDTQTRYSQSQCIHQLFEAQVEQTPDAVALVFEDQQLTYRELNGRANQLAHHLQALGVEPEVLVGLCVERSIEMVVALLGILKAGGAYVPLDPTYSFERLSFMLEDVRSPVLLIQERFLEELPSHWAQVVCLDSDWEVIAKESEENPVSQVTSANLAYVIYTSGSTGEPKGVMISHCGVCNLLCWRQTAFPLTEKDQVLQTFSFSFDASVWQFFWPLWVGARLVMVRPGGHQDSAYLVKLIAQQRVTVIGLVPSLLQMILEEQGVENCNCLRHVTCGGEALATEIQERFFARLNLDNVLHNIYGPTEATIDATFWLCKRRSIQEIAPIGCPITNVQIYLLNSHLQPVPIGVTGDLYIAGVGLARSYLNRSEVTAEKFIPNPFSNEPGARLYKTGDLARYLPDGNIKFLGRMDHQVKIRGFRIELGEIEAVLSQHSEVKETVVLAREDQPGDKRLVAYIIPEQEHFKQLDEPDNKQTGLGEVIECEHVSYHSKKLFKQTPFDQRLFVCDDSGTNISPDNLAQSLRSYLRKILPNYMIPSAFVLLKAMPLTSNGKVDRRALSALDASTRNLKASFVAPRTPTEEILATIWTEVLGLEKVAIHDDFFELGGHSLLATQIISRVREALQVELPLHILFEESTVASLVHHIETGLWAAQALQAPPSTMMGDREKGEI